MPSLSTSFLAWSRFKPIYKTSNVYCQTLLPTVELHVVFKTNQLLPVGIRMYCLPYKIATLFTNFHVTAKVGIWAVLLKNGKTASNNMYRNLSVIVLLSKNVSFQIANANIPPSQQL